MDTRAARCEACVLAVKLRAHVLTPVEQRELAPLGWTNAMPVGGDFRPSWKDDLRPLPPPLPRQSVAHAYNLDRDKFFGRALCHDLARELQWAQAGVDVYLEALLI
jgi:hypothetical protein